MQGPDRVYQLRDFAPRFVEIEDYGKTTETSDRALYEYLLETPSGLPLDPSTPLPVPSPASATPWYPTFRNSFLTTIRCADHEYLELPVACNHHLRLMLFESKLNLCSLPQVCF